MINNHILVQSHLIDLKKIIIILSVIQTRKISSPLPSPPKSSIETNPK